MQQKMVEFMPALKKFFTTWNFRGRASRSEYWWPCLAVFLLSFIPLLGILVALAALVPAICCFVRRMHDIGKSGWWVLLCLIPLVGLYLIYLCILDSEPGINEYGENPKGL